MDRRDALVMMGYQPGQTPSEGQIRARYRSLVRANHANGAPVDRQLFERVKIAHDFLLDPPMDTAVRAALEAEKKRLEQQLVDIEAMVKLWVPDDPRIAGMRDPKVARLAQIEGLFAASRRT